MIKILAKVAEFSISVSHMQALKTNATPDCAHEIKTCLTQLVNLQFVLLVH